MRARQRLNDAAIVHLEPGEPVEAGLKRLRRQLDAARWWGELRKREAAETRRERRRRRRRAAVKRLRQREARRRGW